MKLTNLFPCLSILTAGMPPLLAGQALADVSGTVQADSTLEALGGAAVTLECHSAECADSGQRQTRYADSTGRVRFFNLKVGSYLRTVRWLGFETRQDTVTVVAGPQEWKPLALERLPPTVFEMPPRISGQPRHEAPDGSVAELRTLPLTSKDWNLRVRLSGGTIVGDFGKDDAGGCAGYHSIEHRVDGDTLTVTLFSSLPSACVALYHPVLQRFTIANLRPGRYWTRIFFEGRGGRGGESSGAAPVWAQHLVVPQH